MTLAVRLAPSILSADFARLGEEVREVESAGANRLHLDVMDGRFVPNLSFGPLVAHALRPRTQLPMTAHLMVEDPERQLSAFAEAGVDGILVHVEACPHLQRVVAQIHGLGCRAGVVLNPATPIVLLEEILADVDEVLLMTVNPGWSGQTFLPGSLDKIVRMRQLLDARGLAHVELSVDGGIDEQTAPRVVRAGATVLVIGAAIFAAADGPAAALRRLRRATENCKL